MEFKTLNLIYSKDGRKGEKKKNKEQIVQIDN